MEKDGRGKHGNCGRKKKKFPRDKNLNIRLNKNEIEYYNNSCKEMGLSQANFLIFLLKRFDNP